MSTSKTVRIGVLALAALGCKDGGDTADDSAVTAGDPCEGTQWEGSVICTSWMYGSAAPAVIFTDGEGDAVDVQSVTLDGDLIVVNTDGVPSYVTEITQAIHDALTGRPKAATDFASGAPTVQVGDMVRFGEDIGYNSTGCTRNGDDEGAGYWPPGPECPEALSRSFSLPVDPQPATQTCYTPIATAGIHVNGVALFNWTDGMSYNNQSTWYNLAQVLEVYDVDICNGHAAAGEYHQHFDPVCLTAQLDDVGDAHSPVYGFAGDGYPLYGPWTGAGQRAESCWRARDYSAGSETGCGQDGARTCVLVDNTDPGAGTRAVTNAGPATSDTVTSLSGNTFLATSGTYYEDWYFDADCAAQGGVHLDEHNGHEHDDLGYHYHVTESFPYTAGPTYYGALPSGGSVSCSTSPYPTRP